MKHHEGDNLKDRISSLPDAILADILSLLPSKDAVATSLLSKRWRYLYTWITCLAFDYSHTTDTFLRLKSFVDNVLQNCQSGNISTFKLHVSRDLFERWRLPPGPNSLAHLKPLLFNTFRYYPDPNSLTHLEPLHFNTWMCYPLTRGVRELDICARVRKPSKLPSAIFGCQTLLVLKLYMNLELELPVSVRLPNLKEFHLSLIYFPNDDSVTRLLASCPSLEHLVLKGDWDAKNPVYISAPFLRSLCLRLPDRDLCHRISVVLGVPKLEYLEYQDSFALHYSIGPLNALKEALVDTTFSDEFCPVDAFSSLMSSLSNVERLFLDKGCVEALDLCESNPMLPTFPKLNHLQLGRYDYHDWNKLLMELLNCTPFLETLTFLRGIMDRADENDEVYRVVSEREYLSWSNCQTIPSCLGFHLKKIAIMKYEHSKWELELVKYFLRNSLALEELVLVCRKSVALERKISFDRTLQQLPRSSMVCSIKLQ